MISKGVVNKVSSLPEVSKGGRARQPIQYKIQSIIPSEDRNPNSTEPWMLEGEYILNKFELFTFKWREALQLCPQCVWWVWSPEPIFLSIPYLGTVIKGAGRSGWEAFHSCWKLIYTHYSTEIIAINSISNGGTIRRHIVRSKIIAFSRNGSCNIMYYLTSAGNDIPWKRKHGHISDDLRSVDISELTCIVRIILMWCHLKSLGGAWVFRWQFAMVVQLPTILKTRCSTSFKYGKNDSIAAPRRLYHVLIPYFGRHSSWPRLTYSFSNSESISRRNWAIKGSQLSAAACHS